MTILHPSASLSKGAKYGTSKSQIAFCHIRCHFRWSMIFGDLGVILAVTDMAPRIPIPVGVALR